MTARRAGTRVWVRSRMIGGLLPLLASVPLFPAPGLSPGKASAQETHLVIVVGLGGDPQYRDTFHRWAAELREAAVERHGLAPERILYLGERPDDHPGVVDARSTRENVGAFLARVAGSAAPEDRILVVLLGHGSGQGESVLFNLPGPDLSPGDLDVMLDAFPSQQVAVVVAASSSGPFVQGLSGPNRIVVTATRTAQERNETQFGEFFVEALATEGADLDKDGRTSLLEAFRYASREVERYYQERNLLATEHAQMDDDGDGAGSAEPGGEDVPDGWLARGFWLGAAFEGSAGSPGDSIPDPILRRLYQERAELERRIAELRALRGRMEEAQYERELEELLVAMALKTREIREREGGR